MRAGSIVLCTLFSCSLFPATTHAATGTFEAKGKVAFKTGSGGIYGSANVGDTAVLLLKVAVPGVPLVAGQYENYAIDVVASSLTVGPVVQTFKPGPSLGLQNDFPVADGVHLFTAPLTPNGYAMEFEMFDGTGGNIFSSTDFEDEAGTYLPGLFQALDWNVFTPTGTMGIQLDQFTIQPLTWTDLGHGLAGFQGLTPQLEGIGDLTAGSLVRLVLSDARPSSPAFVVIGLQQIDAPFLGGVFVPSPDIVVPVATDPSGSLVIGATWPAGVPSGFTAFYQCWIADSAAVHGYAASNGLQSTAP